ncbi:MAG: alpha amylase C-terminal domain-containing protein [Clostridiales bacterium]|nr:alpha amylase C-terminal domain-containing protein [Clostridiales bacterium]
MRYEIGQVLKKEQVMELVSGNCSTPKNLLGRHWLYNGQIISAYHPDAVRMQVLADHGDVYEMEKAERQPIFAVFLPFADSFSYQVKMYFRDGTDMTYRDPYSFSCQISEEEESAFLGGKWVEAYQKLGSHPMEIDGVRGIYFAVRMPQAKSVSLVGDFNHWDGRLCPMNRMERSGIYELFVPELEEGSWYAYEVKTLHGKVIRLPDPCRVARKTGDNIISKVIDINKFDWDDDAWMVGRKELDKSREPIVIGCFPEGSKRNVEDITERAFAHVLVGRQEYDGKGSRKRMDGGNHFVSRIYEDNPEEFRNLISKLHRKNIGVLLEIPFGGYSSNKLTGINYLLTNLFFWMEIYHVDGFIFKKLKGLSTTVGNMYQCFDASKEWTAAENTSNANENDMIYSHVIHIIHETNSSILLIADGEGVDIPPERQSELEKEGVDFFRNYSIKWNLEDYLSCDMSGRKREHFRLTSPLQKVGRSHLILCLDHDDFPDDISAHKQKIRENYQHRQNLFHTSIDKKEKVYYDMLSEEKLAIAFLMGIPGKKMFVKDFRNNDVRRYLGRLMNLYHMYPALHECEEHEQIFEWINGMDAETSVVSFLRRSSLDGNQFLFICNFNTSPMEEYRVGVPSSETCVLLVNSDSAEFGGEGRFVDQRPEIMQEPCDFRPCSVLVSLPPESALIFGMV